MTNYELDMKRIAKSEMKFGIAFLLVIAALIFGAAHSDQTYQLNSTDHPMGMRG